MVEYTETWGSLIRQFLRELFGSRLVERLELDLINLRNDMDRQLHDKDVMISSLREEKAMLNSKILVYENTVMARSSRMGAEVVAYQKPAPPKPNFSFFDMPPTKSRWQVFQEQHEEEMRKELEDEAKVAATAAKE